MKCESEWARVRCSLPKTHFSTAWNTHHYTQDKVLLSNLTLIHSSKFKSGWRPNIPTSIRFLQPVLTPSLSRLLPFTQVERGLLSSLSTEGHHSISILLPSKDATHDQPSIWNDLKQRKWKKNLQMWETRSIKCFALLLEVLIELKTDSFSYLQSIHVLDLNYYLF